MDSSSLSVAASPRASRVVIVFSDLNVTLKGYFCRAGQPDVLPATRPVYLQLAAAHAYPHLSIEQSAPPADRDRSAGAGAAAARLAGAPLMNAQPHRIAGADLEKADVDALREARMALDRGAECRHRCRVDIRDREHCVRVADRDRANLVRPARDLEGILLPLAQRLEGKRGG